MELVSIIMPAYNAEKFMIPAIESVINQTYPQWELIIVNDGSTDQTGQKAGQFAAADPRVKVISQQNKRLGGARNAGIMYATGSWIAFLDADDLWHPAKLEVQINAAKAFADAGVIFTAGWIFNNDDLNNLIAYPTTTGYYAAAEMYAMQYQRNNIPVLSVMVKKTIVDTIGLQEEDKHFHGCEDWDFWLRMARVGANFYGVNEKLFYYRRHGSNMSGNVLNMRIAETSVFIKNFDPAIFDQTQSDKIFYPRIQHLLIDLVCAGRRDDAAYIHHGMQGILPSFTNDVNYVLIKLLGKRWYLVHKLRRRLENLQKRIYHMFFKRNKKIGVFPDSANIEVGANFHIGQYRNINLYGSRYQLKIGADVEFREFCNILVQDGSLEIEPNVFFNNYCSINCLNSIVIGEHTLFGEGVKIYDHNHLYSKPGDGLALNKLIVDKAQFTKGTVKIGRNCWIGSNVTILNNVEIGDNVIIGANCLIYKSVPANTIVKHSELLISQKYE